MKVHVRSGICGFTADIEAVSDDMQNVRFTITSDCPNVQRLAEALGEVDAYSELGAKFQGQIHTAAQEARLCNGGCPIPTALHKAAQVTAGLALPADASIEFGE